MCPWLKGFIIKYACSEVAEQVLMISPSGQLPLRSMLGEAFISSLLSRYNCWVMTLVRFPEDCPQGLDWIITLLNYHECVSCVLPFQLWHLSPSLFFSTKRVTFCCFIALFFFHVSTTCSSCCLFFTSVNHLLIHLLIHPLNKHHNLRNL